MSENLINVEDDNPAPAAPVAEAPPPAAPEAPPIAAAPEPAAEADLNAVDVRDEQRVRAIIGELSRLREQNRTLKPAAEKVAQLEAELNQSRPYLDFIRANPHLLQPRQPEPQTAPAKPAPDPDAEEAARLMDFYKQDGTPDVDRGARWLALQDKRSGRVAQQAVQPWAQQNVQERANANYGQLRAWSQQQGIRPEIVDGIWNSARNEPNGLQALANPDSVRALALLALGAHSMATPKQPAPPAQPPVVTEASGGRVNVAAARLSPIEEQVLKQRGMTQTTYESLTKGFKPGASNVLEED